MRKKTGIIPFALATTLLLTACASTRLTSSWKDPGVTTLDFTKVVAIAITANDTISRVAEDEMVRQIQKPGGTQAVASHTVLREAEHKDVEKAKAKLGEMGFDGAVTRLLRSGNHLCSRLPPDGVLRVLRLLRLRLACCV